MRERTASGLVSRSQTAVGGGNAAHRQCTRPFPPESGLATRGYLMSWSCEEDLGSDVPVVNGAQ